MPKEIKDRSVSKHKLWASPYQCSTGPSKQPLTKNPLERDEILQEWEDARCPVCMEHPHNAILLLCSSHDKGCRPFMCDTSYRHSNCFDQFKKTLLSDVQMSESLSEESQTLSSAVFPEPSTNAENVVKAKSKKLSCPLCRGEVNGTVVVDAARLFMNTKSRSCANETCDFLGTYADLRKHARNVHPFARPSEADPQRREDWCRMERQRDIGDLLSSLRSTISEDYDEDGTSGLSANEGRSGLTVIFQFVFFRSAQNIRLSSSSSGSPARAQVTTARRRSRAPLFGEIDDDESSDGVESSPGPHSFY